MSLILWFLVGVTTVGAAIGVAVWIDHRWQHTQQALTLHWSSTSRHGLALSTLPRLPPGDLRGVVTRRFYGTREIERTRTSRA